jgi:hypothetical protein
MENTETNTQPTAVDKQDSTPVSTDTPSVEKEQAKTFTQEELDKVVAERLAREKRKYEKKYDGIDIEQYNELTAKAEKERNDKLKAKGEFEKILKETVEKKDAQLNQYKAQISSIKIDGNLTDLAAKSNAVNPGQVVQLLKNQVRLGDDGEVEIVDLKTDSLRYTENGTLMTANDLVNEFLQANPHFVKASPGGSSSESKIGMNKGVDVDIANLDMNNPDHRAKYGAMLKAKGNRYTIK